MIWKLLATDIILIFVLAAINNEYGSRFERVCCILGSWLVVAAVVLMIAWIWF